jgi:serine/threonine protein kinase
MHYAHGQGVLHRDIKPANLLLASDESGEHERVWIADFGLALALESDAERSECVGTPGTLRYMPVEQLEGQPTAQSDIYSLGLTLFELLAGHPAFEGMSPSRLLQCIRQGERPALPKGERAAAPYDFEVIVLKATEPDQTKRYATAKDLADDLERLLTNYPVRARHVTSLEHAIRWMQRNPLAAALSCIATILLIGVITTTTVGYFSAKAGERREAALRASEQEQRMREAEQRERAEAALQVAMESLDELFTQIESSRRPGQRLDSDEARGMLDALKRMLAFYEQLAIQGHGGPTPRFGSRKPFDEWATCIATSASMMMRKPPFSKQLPRSNMQSVRGLPRPNLIFNTPGLTTRWAASIATWAEATRAMSDSVRCH